jgi:hypothetical protein
MRLSGLQLRPQILFSLNAIVYTLLRVDTYPTQNNNSLACAV